MCLKTFSNGSQEAKPLIRHECSHLMCFAHAIQTHQRALLKERISELLKLKCYLCFGNELLHLKQRGCSKAGSVISAFSLILDQKLVSFTFPRCCTPCISPSAAEVTPSRVPLGTTSARQWASSWAFTYSIGIYISTYG